MTVYQADLVGRDITAKLVAAGLISYYLIPLTIPFLHFSPHLLFFGAAFPILLLQMKWSVFAQKEVIALIIIIFGSFLFSILLPPFINQKQATCVLGCFH